MTNEGEITATASHVAVRIIRTDEELMIVRWALRSGAALITD